MESEIEIKRSERRGFGSSSLLPLIDVVFQLLIFFVLTSTFTQITGMDVELPESSTAKSVQKDVVAVSVTPDGTYRIGDHEVTRKRLEEALRTRIGPSGGTLVRVNADRASRVHQAVYAIDAARRAGARRAVLSTRTPRGLR